MARTRKRKLKTREEIAAAFGVHPGTVTRWERNGMPVAKRAKRGKHTLFDENTVKEWRERVEAEEEVRGLDLAAERAKLARRQTEKIELELSVRRGELVEHETVVLAARATVVGWTAMVRGIPRRLVQAGLITASQEPAAAIVCRDVLDEISKWKSIADVKLEDIAS